MVFAKCWSEKALLSLIVYGGQLNYSLRANGGDGKEQRILSHQLTQEE